MVSKNVHSSFEKKIQNKNNNELIKATLNPIVLPV